jgi:hypothetical protein
MREKKKKCGGTLVKEKIVEFGRERLRVKYTALFVTRENAAQWFSVRWCGLRHGPAKSYSAHWGNIAMVKLTFRSNAECVSNSTLLLMRQGWSDTTAVYYLLIHVEEG